MKQKMAKKLLCIAAVGMMFPMAVQAAEADLQLKVDALTKEVNDLKGSVKKVEDHSLGKWLTIGGDYRFRMDNLHGETVAYSDAIGTMNKLVGGMVVGPHAVAGFTIGNSDALTPTNIANPSAAGFIFQGKAGTLFTPTQFSTIMNQYMPSAMYAAFFGQDKTKYFAADMVTPTVYTTDSLAGMMMTGTLPAVLGTPLTAQQNAILATLVKNVLPKMMPLMSDAQVTMFNGLMANANMSQAAFTALMNSFLGTPSGNLDTVQAFKPKNETIYTNKFGLDLKAKAAQDLTVNVKLDMYKTFGSQSDTATSDGYFADRVGVFDGTLGHVPSSGLLNVDRAYATWSNIADQPVWFSVGRRPATNGAPSNLRMNTERPGNGGTPALLVDYAFDGMTIGYAPDIDFLPGFYTKLCYGRGFESGLQTPTNSIKDTDMLGFAVIPVDTDPLRVWLQWNRGFSIFDFPVMSNTLFGNTAPAVNLGSIDWYGAGAMSTFKDVGPGSLNFFADLGLSITHPNLNVSNNAGFQGLLSGAFFAQDFAPKDQTGWAGFVGIRYDLPSKTKIGFEFNHGSEYWIPFSPASDDMWTAKVGTRGNVYEPYLIQELDLKPISSHLSKGFIKVGYQYYDFEYTGSNNWVGAPVKISDIKSTDLMLMAPVKKAQDIYATFEVKF